MSITETITLAVAVLGAALGLINTWHNINQNTLKLRVTPKHAIPYGAASQQVNFCIEVINLSAFAVTVNEVGVRYRGTSRRAAYIEPLIIDGGPWPRRLEPREAVTVYGSRPTSLGAHSIRRAYAKTDCGEVKYGTSGALRQIADEARSA